MVPSITVNSCPEVGRHLRCFPCLAAPQRHPVWGERVQPPHLWSHFNFLAEQLDQWLVVAGRQHCLIPQPHLQLQGAQVASEIDGAENHSERMPCMSQPSKGPVPCTQECY